MQRLRALHSLTFMLDTNVILILTHILAFAFGACSIILFNSIFGDDKHHSSRDHHHNHKHSVIGAEPNYETKENKSVASKTASSERKEVEKSVQEKVSEPKEKTPSHKEIRNQQRKEEKARKRQEEIDRKAALAEAKRKQSFNPRISKPENVTYINLGVSDGKLVPCSVGQTSYYRYWEYEGRFFYEFFCEPSKVAKAVNNRSVIIDPFCQKDSDSVAVDESKSMTINEFGELDGNLNIISKSIISYQ